MKTFNLIILVPLYIIIAICGYEMYCNSWRKKLKDFRRDLNRRWYLRPGKETSKFINRT